MPLYPRYEQASLNQSTNTNLMSGIVKMVLVNSGLYTYSDTHEFIEDVSNAARVGVSLALTGKSSTNGTFASEAIIFPALIALQANAIILFIDTGNESTSRLVFFSNDVIGLPVTPALNDSATLNIGNYLFTTNTQDTSSATKESLGLDLVDNTADINKPISILTQSALDDKQDLLISGQNIKSINNESILGTGNLVVVGGGGVSAWGELTGALEDQVDLWTFLQTLALDSDLNIVTTDLSTLTTVVTGKSAIGHQHVISDIDGLTTALNAKATITSVTTVSNDLAALTTVVTGKQNALGFTAENIANKSTVLTSPDNIKYPTTLAVSTALTGKSDTGHTHLLSAITNVTATATEVNYLTGVSSSVQTQLNAKQNTIANSDSIVQGATNLFLTSSERTKLTGIQAGAEVNVNPDWNASSGDAQILNKPTTLSGYGITDAQPLDTDLSAIAALPTTSFGRGILIQADGAAIRTYIGAGTSNFDGNYSSLSNIPTSFAPSSHNQPWSTITGTPTTLAGYGITDGGGSSFDGNYNSLSNIPTTFTPSSHNQPWSTITSTPTTLSGYGITDAQPLDTDLTAIAALTTTAFGRGILSQVDSAAVRTYIGAGTSNFDGNYNSLSNIPTTFTPSSHNQAWSTITGTPTTLSGYGITDAQPFITAGTTTQYYRGDKSFQTLDKTAVGLPLVENTTLSTWIGSSFITTLGTIITGTWNGTAIEDTYISSASVWNAKQNALGFIPENVSNKATSLTSPDNTKYPTTLAVSTALANIVSGGGLTQQQIMRLAL